jgi:hypothetical protein
MENEIRPADKPIKECLLPNPANAYDSEEYQLQKILKESREAFEIEEQERWFRFSQREPSEFLSRECSATEYIESPELVPYETELQHAVLLSRRLQEEKETREAQVLFCKIRFTQFMQIDRLNRLFYAEMIQHIEKYESGDLESVSIGKDNHTRLCQTLNNMRITPEDKSCLLQILIQ